MTVYMRIIPFLISFFFVSCSAEPESNNVYSKYFETLKYWEPVIVKGGYFNGPSTIIVNREWNDDGSLISLRELDSPFIEYLEKDYSGKKFILDRPSNEVWSTFYRKGLLIYDSNKVPTALICADFTTEIYSVEFGIVVINKEVIVSKNSIIDGTESYFQSDEHENVINPSPLNPSMIKESLVPLAKSVDMGTFKPTIEAVYSVVDWGRLID